MNRHTVTQRRRLSLRARFRRYWGKTERRGSVLIVVIGLLLLLMLVGFTFVTFSTQERSSAEYYADAAKVWSVDPNSTTLFDFALEQLIIGPRDSNSQSALWPGRHSLVPNMLGMFWFNQVDNTQPTVPTDRQPFNGGWGVNVISNVNNGLPNGVPGLDQNFDGVADGNGADVPHIKSVDGYLLTTNFSQAAQQSAAPSINGNGTANAQTRQQIYANYPAIDVGYTYPDINNMFLAYLGKDLSGNTIITPSFHRPQYMRGAAGLYTYNSNTGIGWQNDNSGGPTDTTVRVLRPHPGHVIANSNPKVLRFIGPNENIPNALGNQIQPFPFLFDANSDGIFGSQGVWDSSLLLDFDVDNDGDGKNEGIWLDLGFPVMVLPDGRRMVPLFSFTVIEADGLINLNATGNMTWLTQLNAVSPKFYGNSPASSNPLLAQLATSPASISHSNLGVSSTEINPWWALVANPQDQNYLSPTNSGSATSQPSSALQQYRGFFGFTNPSAFTVDRIEVGNMDLMFLLWGRPQYNVTAGNNGTEQFTFNDVITGLWGEGSGLVNGINNNNPLLFPRPGNPNFDDNFDSLAGVNDAATDFIFSTGSTIMPPFGQPSDFIGVGQWFVPGANTNFNSGAVPFLTMPAPLVATQSLQYSPYLTYVGYESMSNMPTLQLAPPQPYYATQDPYGLNFTGSFGASLSLLPENYGLPFAYSGQSPNGLVDEAAEVVNDRRYTQSSNDQPFTPDESAALQLAQADYLAVLGQSRLRQLMSFNFESNLQAAVIRQHFTTESWDRRQHALALQLDPTPLGNVVNTSLGRAWEYSQTVTGMTSSGTPSSATVSANWDGLFSSNGLGQFPPMSLGSSGNASVGNTMENQVPALVDTPVVPTQWGTNPYSSTASEPIRVELAALIGATQANGLITLPGFAGNSPLAFSTPAYDFPTPPPGFNNNQLGKLMTPWQQQLRVNANRLTTVQHPNLAFGANNPANSLEFRELTPHPTLNQWTNWQKNTGGDGSQSLALIFSGNSQTPPQGFASDMQNFSTSAPLQEYWARRDRQQMARDIYVMLYLFCGGQDGINYATTPNTVTSAGPPVLRTLYHDWQLAEMAQFAVNYVDALDRDDTITVFEYDKNLADGWNLDDDPYGTLTTDPIASSADRGVAYGVEAQQLAFSEALVIVSRQVQQKATPGKYIDHPATLLDDSLGDRTFAYLELANVNSSPVPLGNQNWQILLLDPRQAIANYNPYNSSPSAALTVLTLADGQNVAAGQTYVIGTRKHFGSDIMASTTTPWPSGFYVDWSWNGQSPDALFQNVASAQALATLPAQVVPAAPAPPAAGITPATIDLDLVTAASSRFILTQGASTSADTTLGDFVDFTFGIAPPNADATKGIFNQTAGYQATFVLRRRLNLNRPAPQILSAGGSYTGNDADNPYIEVDRITHVNSPTSYDTLVTTTPPLGTTETSSYFFNPVDPATVGASASAAQDLQPKLGLLFSRERMQPLDGYEGTSTSALGLSPPNPNVLANLPTSSQRVPYYPNPPSTGPNPPSTGWTAPSWNPPPGYSVVANTIGQVNSQAPTNPQTGMASYTLWQPHFDRDFASVMELLSIPLYGPAMLTQAQAPLDPTPFSKTAPARNSLSTGYPLPAKSGTDYLPLVAQEKFFRPLYPKNLGQAAGSTQPQLDNRWHRLFELIEVPPRENLQIEHTFLSGFPWTGPLALQRTPGRINLNGLRHGENLFALLDDPVTFNMAGYMAGGTGSYPDKLEATLNRDWWQQLLFARDNLDPMTGLYLPGSPTSRPFRPYGSFEYNPNNWSTGLQAGSSLPNFSTDDTLLKMLPLDMNTTYGNYAYGNAAMIPANATMLETRQLFEARAKADKITGGGGIAGPTNSVDFYTRNRLLSKIAGNSTQRSNVFFTWITVGFFEAWQDPNPAANTTPNVRIGGEMTDQTRRRGFFVIDRSMLEDAWTPSYQGNVSNGAVLNTSYYDYKKFIQYGKTIQ